MLRIAMIRGEMLKKDEVRKHAKEVPKDIKVEHCVFSELKLLKKKVAQEKADRLT